MRKFFININYLLKYSIITIIISSNYLNAQDTLYNNSLSILGETNINQFELKQENKWQSTWTNNYSGWLLFESESEWSIHIPVEEFKTSNPLLYADFIKLVKADTYPDIVITLSKKILEDLISYDPNYLVRISVKMAGVNNEYLVDCDIFPVSVYTLSIKGSRSLKLTDFKLTPPTKSLGLIRVKNDVIINFEFNIPTDLIGKN